MSDITLETAKKQIETAIAQNGPYSHNIVGLTLSSVASALGTTVANDLIVEYALTTRYGIRPVEESSVAVKEPVKEKTRDEIRAEREIREAAERRAKRQVLVGKLVNLGNEIEALTPGYLKYTEVQNNWGEPEVYLEAKSAKFDDVYARVVYKKGWSGWHENGKVYVRIETSDWDYQFKRNWTFDTKDLAKKVLAKAQELIRGIESKREARIQQKETDKLAREKVSVEFPQAETVYVSGNHATFYLKEGKADYNISYDTYGIELTGLTRDQLRRVLEIKQESKDE